MEYTSILTEVHGKVGLVRFNRPQVRNALNSVLLGELAQALEAFDADPEIGVYAPGLRLDRIVPAAR